jgi:hypothetical protein
LALALLVAGAACGGEARRSEDAGELDTLDTVDVGPPIDADASLEADAIERAVGLDTGGVAGALPEDFPADVPLPVPSTLVDFGRGWIELEVAGDREGVRTAYSRQLAAAGFAAGEDGRWRRAGRHLRVDVRGAGAAARVRIEVLAAAR